LLGLLRLLLEAVGGVLIAAVALSGSMAGRWPFSRIPCVRRILPSSTTIGGSAGGAM
jgi:hypothetical protein